MATKKQSKAVPKKSAIKVASKEATVKKSANKKLVTPKATKSIAVKTQKQITALVKQSTKDKLAVRTGSAPLNNFPRFISGFFAVVKPPLMLTAGF